jgi:hypothetical protein
MTSLPPRRVKKHLPEYTDDELLELRTDIDTELAARNGKVSRAIEIKQQSELVYAQQRGIEIGAWNTLSVAKSMVGIEIYSALINRAAWRKSGRDLLAELKDLSPLLAQATAVWVNSATENGLPKHRIAYVKGRVADIQDAANKAIDGDEGAALRKLFPDHLLSTAFEHEGVKFMPERLYIGKRAVELRKLRTYQGHGGWIKIGLALIEEFTARVEAEAKAALAWLKTYEVDRADFSDKIRHAHDDYERLRFRA